jgi:ribose 5-phosphate isomerase A
MGPAELAQVNLATEPFALHVVPPRPFDYVAQMTDPDVAKRAAAYAAADLVQDGTTIGLGSGSTFLFVLERLAERMHKEGLQVRGTPTSSGTAAAAEAQGIALVSLDEIEQLDLAIDGADEVDPHKHLIKGGGAAHTRERIVAATAKELVIIVGENKMVEVLGKAFRLPVEVLPFGWTHARRRVEATGCTTELRQHDGKPKVTDNGNWILDCTYPGIPDPAALAASLDSMVGVVDHGLFVGMTGRVVIADDAGSVRILP